MQLGQSTAADPEIDEERQEISEVAPVLKKAAKPSEDTAAEDFVKDITDFILPGDPGKAKIIIAVCIALSILVGCWSMGMFSAPVKDLGGHKPKPQFTWLYDSEKPTQGNPYGPEDEDEQENPGQWDTERESPGGGEAGYGMDEDYTGDGSSQDEAADGSGKPWKDDAEDDPEEMQDPNGEEEPGSGEEEPGR